MRILILFAFSMLLSLEAAAQVSRTRIVDVGSGLCVLTKTDAGTNMIYDTGHWSNKNCINQAIKFFDSRKIKLMVISHSDSDHLGNAASILENFHVENVLMTGYARTTKTYQNFIRALLKSQERGTKVVRLDRDQLSPGQRFDLEEEMYLTFLSGYHHWDKPANGMNKGELRNVGSIVLKLNYGNNSILFTGDVIGRLKYDEDHSCKFAEKEMTQRHASGIRKYNLKSDILIASHHGGNNASSTCFLEAVKPKYVVFSSGHAHNHPTSAVANRILSAGVSILNIFRTDRGDNEGGYEWTHGNSQYPDKAGDDHYTVIMGKNEGKMSILQN